ncbi:hypothetical protein M011DRAFT_412088, partial [Sporormia fimetaria CBS 119925]
PPRPARSPCHPRMPSNTDIQPRQNKRSRPVRRTAGKKKSDPVFVDTTTADLGDDEAIEAADTSSSDEGPTTPIAARSKKRKQKKRRTSSPFPVAPPLDPIIYNEDADEPSDSEQFKRKSDNPAVTLQFNVPLGYHGPLEVKLNSSQLSALSASLCAPSSGTLPSPTTDLINRQTGFLKLPAELRNTVYELVFIADAPLDIRHPDNFRRSAQFLRTCRTVFHEASDILYGQNRFVFARNHHQRAPFWEPQLKEIGYQDVRQFLKMIGPENLLYLRDIHFTFEDATPSATRYLADNEARRFINDDHLIDCLRILRGARLRKLTLDFHGRRVLCATDVRFLSYLEQIKADEVVTTERSWYNLNKIQEHLWRDLKVSMTRKTKLYREIK